MQIDRADRRIEAGPQDRRQGEDLSARRANTRRSGALLSRCLEGALSAPIGWFCDSSGQPVGPRAWFTSRRTAQASATGPRCASLSGLFTSGSSGSALRLRQMSRCRTACRPYRGGSLPAGRSPRVAPASRRSGRAREDWGRHPGYLLGADDAPGQRRGLAAGCPGQLDVSGEQLLQAVDVAFPERVEEPRRQFLSLPAVRLEPRAPCVYVAPRPHRKLTARRLDRPTADAISGSRTRTLPAARRPRARAG